MSEASQDNMSKASSTNNNVLNLHSKIISDHCTGTSHIKSEHGLTLFIITTLKDILLCNPQLRISSKNKQVYKKRQIGCLKEVLQYSNLFEYVSFDFFDTLFVRTVEPPEAVKLKVANYACLLLGQYGIETSSTEFMAVRNFLEFLMRAENNRHSDSDSETTLDKIIVSTVNYFGHTLSEVNRHYATSCIVKFELEAETACLRLNHHAQETLKKLAENNKKIFIISDMYMSRKQLEYICEQHGILKYITSIFVSADATKAKSSGKLFSHVAESLTISFDQLLHIGDNIYSDVCALEQMGGNACWLYQKKQLKRRVRERKRTRIFNETKSHSIQKKILKKIETNQYLYPAKQASTSSIENNLLYQTIIKSFSPALVMFAFNALRDMHKIGIKKAYFLAREGIVLENIFKLLQENVLEFKMLPEIEFFILHASRNSSTPASVISMTDLDYFSQTTKARSGDISISNFLRTFRLDLAAMPQNVRSIFEVYLKKNTKKDLEAVLKNPVVKKHLGKHFKHKNEIFVRYLRELDFFKQDSIALVDVGWNGTIQKNIDRAISGFSKRPTIFGFYIGTLNSHYAFDQNPQNRIFPGYASSNHNATNIFLLSRGAPVIEALLSIPRGTTLGYKKTETGASPIWTELPDDAHKEHLTKLSSLVQYACIKSVERFIPLLNSTCLDRRKLTQHVNNNLFSLVCMPTHSQAASLSNIVFDMGGIKQSPVPLICKVEVIDLLLFQNVIRKLTTSSWIYGTLAYSRLRPLCWLIKAYAKIHTVQPNMYALIRRTINRLNGRNFVGPS